MTSVTITPGSSSSATGATLQFTANVSGSSAVKTVTWKANLGQITSDGLYTAPSQPGTDTVTATSDADATETASAQVTVTAPSNGPLPAFPGAQGGGAAAVGGRGGEVIEVTNLNDSGSGSLRACVETNGPRTCVFRVAGIITGKSDLIVRNPYLTIAGQTAPGEIILGGPKQQGEALRVSTHDVVVRYITFSPDNPNTPSGPDTGTVGFSITNAQSYNVITDHISARWAGNKSWIAYAGYSGEYSKDTSFQWSMLYEPHEGHPVGPSTSAGDNPTRSIDSPNADFHHLLIVNVSHRIPEYNNYSMRWVNNITYNYSFYAVEGLGATKSDVIGNIWDYANLVPSQEYPIHSTDGNWPGSIPGTPSFYVAGNIGHGRTTANPDQIGDLTYQITGENGYEIHGHFPANWVRSTPLPASNAFPILPDAAEKLTDILLPTVGNSQHVDCNGNWQSHRDAADLRIINQYKNHAAGGYWPNGVTFMGQSSFPNPTSGWQDDPVVNGTVCKESLGDGIPDQWKVTKDLSTTDRNLHKTVAPNGYTWLENYINGQ